jgi:hypothetical protein
MFTIGSAEGAEVFLAKLSFTFFSLCCFLYNRCFMLKVVLSSTKIIDKGREYDFIQAWLATGLLTSTGIHREIQTAIDQNEQNSLFLSPLRFPEHRRQQMA